MRRCGGLRLSAASEVVLGAAVLRRHRLGAFWACRVPAAVQRSGHQLDLLKRESKRRPLSPALTSTLSTRIPIRKGERPGPSPCAPMRRDSPPPTQPRARRLRAHNHPLPPRGALSSAPPRRRRPLCSTRAQHKRPTSGRLAERRGLQTLKTRERGLDALPFGEDLYRSARCKTPSGSLNSSAQEPRRPTSCPTSRASRLAASRSSRGARTKTTCPRRLACRQTSTQDLRATSTGRRSTRSTARRTIAPFRTCPSMFSTPVS